MTLRYRFNGFRVDHDPAAGSVVTAYDDGHCSPVEVNDDHAFHAGRIGGGMTAGAYNLAHELAHHLVSLYVLQWNYSLVVWRSAHGRPQLDPQRQLEEWLATALTYYALGADMRDAQEYGALIDIARRTSPAALARLLRWLLLPALERVPGGVAVELPRD